jgi:hypothetical protein
VTSFGEWSTCSKTCGTGFQTRTREVVNKEDFGGVECPFLGEYRKCAESPCPIDCVLSSWTLWSACSVSCGTGQATRTRNVEVAADFGGKSCASDHEEQDCNVHSCAESCLVSEWGTWSSCTKSCGGGTATRHRTVTRAAAFGGGACAALDEEQACASEPCAIDCVAAAWSSWSTCTKSCGAGKHGRSRVVATPAVHGGKECGALTEEGDCNHTDDKLCPVHCAVSEWSGWTQCSKSCGSGFKSHERSILEAPLRGGTACPVLEQTVACNGHECQIDCTVGEWGTWGECSQNCGGGKRARTRPILGLAMHGGKQCPTLSELESCNTQGCACSHVKCEFSKHTATGHMRIKVLHHNAEQRGHSHVCGYDYASGGCACKCYGPQKWHPVGSTDGADAWKAKSFSLSGRTVPSRVTKPDGNARVHALDESHLVHHKDVVSHRGRVVAPKDHHQCTGVNGAALGDVLQVIENLDMQGCMKACNDEDACNCVAQVEGDCRLSTGLKSARLQYTSNVVGGGSQLVSNRGGGGQLISMELPVMPTGASV